MVKIGLICLEEIEKELNLPLHPMAWPINSGKEFKGVYNLYDKSLVLFTANTKAVMMRTPLKLMTLTAPCWTKSWGKRCSNSSRRRGIG